QSILCNLFDPLKGVDSCLDSDDPYRMLIETKYTVYYSLLLNRNFQEISPEIILCDAQQDPCKAGRLFNAQIAILEHKLLICLDHSTVLHIDTIIAEVQLKN
ncbi:unnamed protein product, partial [Rotaria sp. Silwood2]